MSGELAKAFLSDMVENIDDDTPRLIYADWLEENGRDDRAEFIRVQVELTRRPAWEAGAVRLKLREQALLKQHGEQWLAELPNIEGARWEGFRRGIIAEVSFASFEAMRASAHLCRAAAPIEAVTVRWPRKREGRQASEPIAELRELSLTGRPDSEDEVTWLAESPQLSTLRILTARGLWFDGFESLMASPHLGNIRSLRLPANNLGNAGILALLAADSLTAVEELDLSWQGLSNRYSEDPIIQAPGMESLARWDGLANLVRLNLSGNEVGAAGLRHLLRSPNAAGLKELALRGTGLDGQAMSEFRNATAGLRLESLDVGENVLKELGVEYLATAQLPQDLKSLKLDRCEVPLTGARVFAKKAVFLAGLRVLDIAFNHFGPAGLAALLDAKPAALHTLSLRDNDLFDHGVEALAAHPAVAGLLELDLSRNALSEAATQALAASPHLANLRVLKLEESRFSESAGAEFAASPLGRRLVVLEMKNPPLPMTQDNIPF